MTDNSADGAMTATEIRGAYGGLARWFDRFELLNKLATGRARARLFGDVSGRVLDVACGTGTNRQYIPSSAQYIGIDLSRAMLTRADQRLSNEATLIEMDVEALAFTDDTFDAVISSLSTCTFPNRTAALTEMARVCRPGGRLYLLEHGRTGHEPIDRLLTWYAPRHYAHSGCRIDQDPVAAVKRAGLTIETIRRGYLGSLTAMVVQPDSV